MVGGQSIELDARTLTLFSKQSFPTGIQAGLPFSVPIPPDAPQCIHTRKATIAHKLTATLHSFNRPPLQKSITVHSRRYSQRSGAPLVTPEAYTIADPAEIRVELPRRTFYAGEVIPLYVTVPPLDRSVLERKDLVLRNITAELRRSVTASTNKAAPATLNESEAESSQVTSSSTAPVGEVVPVFPG